MKVAEAKELLTRHINDSSWVKERNLDVTEIQKFKDELDNSADTDLNVEQTCRFIEVLTNKEFFKVFHAVKDYLTTENILTQDNLIEAVNYLEKEFHCVENNEEAAVKIFKDGIAQLRKRLHDEGIFSKENEAAVLQNFKHSDRIVTALKALNTAKILNPKNRTSVIRIYQNSETGVVAFTGMLEQLNITGIFKQNQEQNQTNFDTVCLIAQNAELYYISPILSVLNKAGILDQTSFNMICQNVQYAKNISIAFMNDMSEKTENILNRETLAAIYQNPNDAVNIVTALKILKSENILNQEIQTDICQNPQHAAVIAEHAFKFVLLLEELKVAGTLNPETLIAICQNPEHARNIVHILKILKTENLLNSETQTVVCQNPHIVVNIKYSVDSMIFLRNLNTANLLNSETFITLCQNLQHDENIVQFVQSLKTLKAENLLNSETQTAVCKNPRYARYIANNLQILKSHNILDSETQTAICKNPQYAGIIVNTLNFLNENFLNPKNLTAVCQNVQHVQVINAALKALMKAHQLTQSLIDDIFSNPKDALFIAEKNGGKPAGDKIAKDFSEIRTASQVLAQAWRGKHPLASKSIENENSAIALGDLPPEMLVKIASAVTSQTNPEDALDTVTAEYVVSKTFSK